MLMEQLSSLVACCDEDERDLVERMILESAAYTGAVVCERTRALNYAGRKGEELRTAVEEADRERTRCHNSLISYVDIVNRICISHDLPKLYTGSSIRREYGNFAFQLITELYEHR